MYAPEHFQIEDKQVLLAFMRQHVFAVLVSERDGAPFATHLPLLAEQASPGIKLRGHVARANPHWRSLSLKPDALAIFHGPHAYVSPSLYHSRAAVPTWNYIAVHAYGKVRLLEAESDKVALLESMIGCFEPSYKAQWDALAQDYRHNMLGGIVAFQIEVERLEGKFKLSQNRPADDRARVADALLASPESGAAEIATWMKRLAL